MALKITETKKFPTFIKAWDGKEKPTGKTVAESRTLYIRVDSIGGDKRQMTANLHCLDFTTKDDLGEYLTVDFTPDLNGVNFIAQAYDHMKTLQEYKSAVDA